MQLSIHQKPLAKAVETASRFVPTKSPVPVLSGVKLTVLDNDTLVIGATDLECGVLVSVPAVVKDAGEVVIPAKVFTSFIKHLPDTELTLQTKGQNLQLKADGTNAEFNGFSVEEYPMFDIIKDEDYEITFPYSVFRQVLDQTLYCVSTDNARTIFTGQLWQPTENGLILVATDVHRLTFRRLRNIECSKSISGIVPGKMLQNALRSFSDESVNVYLSETQIKFRSGNITIFGRLISGNYPDWRRMIPGEEVEAMCMAKVEPAEMLDTLSRVAALGSDPPIVRLAASASGIDVSGCTSILST